MLLKLLTLAVAALLLLPSGARADVVFGALEDPRGDGHTTTQVWPYDLGVYEFSYDDAGTITAAFTYFREPTAQFGFVYTVGASVGTWDAALQICDVSSSGGL